MKITRRDALLAAGGAFFLTGCGPLSNRTRAINQQPATLPRVGDDPYVAVVNRFGFGHTPGQIDEMRRHTLEQWFESQLLPGDTEPQELSWMLGRMEINYLGPYDLRDWKEEPIVMQMQQAAILRAVYSPWQLRERMVDFWTNHLNIYAKKGLAVYRKPMDEREVVRKHALGNFRDMIHASSRSTAMLVYLDQQASTKAHPNENYARELLELHTLGVNGGYTQQDVMEAARCFTGWSEERRFLKKRGAFRFIDSIHDKGEKTFLGEKIPAGGGVEDGERVVNLALDHPATGRYLATKLCRYFLGHTDQGSVDALAAAYQERQGDIPSMMRVVFREFQKRHEPVVKRPLDYLASSMRAVQASSDAGKEVLRRMEQMGQPLYLWPMPDGYPLETDSWTGSLLARWNFAHDLAHRSIKGSLVDVNKLTKTTGSSAIPSVIFGQSDGELISHFASVIAGLEPSMAIAACLASPEFQWR